MLIPADLAGQQLEKNILNKIHYRSIGPTRQSGRFVDFAVPRQLPSTFYAATGSGHLWKTTNNGQSFEALFENESVFSIGDIAIAPSDPDTLWVGTGEANTSRSMYYGDGVYKSVDAGKTFMNMGLNESHHIGRIVIHPKNADIVYVAAMGHLYSDNPERGLYKTEDGGKTWNLVLAKEVDRRHIGVIDCKMDPQNPDILYAATYDKVRKPYTFNLGGPGSRIYKTTDAGATWDELGGGLPDGMLGRIGITVYAKDPSILYACIENANKPGMSDEERYKELLADKSSRGMIDGEIYRSDDAGTTWKKVSPDGQSIGGAPGYYYGQIYVDPNNDKVVHVLSAASWGTRDGGEKWLRRPLGFGGDDHALWIDPDNSDHILIGYDHGLGVTWDGGKNWYHPDFLSLAQFYAVGFDYSYPYRVAGGLQDNGSHAAFNTKPGSGGGRGFMMGGGGSPSGPPILFEDWISAGGGDGMYNEFDWKTNRYLYNESQFGPLQRLDLKTGERKSIAYSRQDPEMRWNWCAPILVSPHDSDVIYHCGNKVVKSPFRGEYWEVISPDLTSNNPEFMTTGKGGDGNIQFCTITTIDESTLVQGLLWVGTDDGNVWVSRNGGADWKKLNDNIKGNPGCWVSRVAASHYDSGTAYVSYTGLRRDDFRPFVYKTNDYGETWTSIAGNLPDGSVNVVREDPCNPNLIYAGTDFGVFISIDGGRTWSSMKANMPTQPVHDLKIHPREKDLIVATHGRGIYIADISVLQELDAELLAKDTHVFEIEDKIRWVDGVSYASSSSNFSGESEPPALAVNYYLKNASKEKVKIEIYMGSLLVNELEGKADAGINQALWNMTRRRKRTEAEKKQMEELMERARAMGYRSRMGGNQEYTTEPAKAGEYTFVVTIGGNKFMKKASILEDVWFDKR